MIRCPYCAEEIQGEAAKCKHCGEWLDESKRPAQPPGSVKADNSGGTVFQCYAKDFDGRWKTMSVVAANIDDARTALIAKLPRHWEIKAEKIWTPRRGQFSCPACRSPYTECQKNAGCLFIGAVVVSFGLALLLYPFLKYDCRCLACNHRWRA